MCRARASYGPERYTPTVTARPRAAARPLMLAGILTGLLAVAGCQSDPPLANTQDSARAVAQQVLDAIARRDRAALDALAITEPEFRVHVWPSLPAARPERNLPMSYVWGDLHQKSTASLSRILAQHGERRYELVDVRFAEAATPYDGYTVHRKAVLTVRGAGGATEGIRVCGSLIEKDGRWKVFSYVIDD
jgi:hypothetical protein